MPSPELGNSQPLKGKKTTIACNLCRQKRQKCDGVNPNACSYCIEYGQECSYSQQQRRRGPPPGYLRHIDVRLRILETFIGFLTIEASENPTTSTALQIVEDAARRFVSQAKAKDEAVWSKFHGAFKGGTISSVLQDTIDDGYELPLPRTEFEIPPPVAGVKRARSSSSSMDKRPQMPSIFQTSPPQPKSLSPVPENTHPRGGEIDRSTSGGDGQSVMDRVMGNNHLPPQPPVSGLTYQAGSGPAFSNAGPSASPSHPNGGALSPFDFGPPAFSSTTPASAINPSSNHAGHSAWSLGNGQNGYGFTDLGEDRMDNHGGALEDDGGFMGIEEDDLAQQGVLLQVCEGRLWRSITRAVSESAPSPRLYAQLENPTETLELPPKHVQDHLFAVHFEIIHPFLPFLDPAHILSSTSSTTAATGSGSGLRKKPPSAVLVLAICAYSVCFSPSLGEGGAPGSGLGMAGMGEDSAGGVAAQIWYEKARTTVMNQSLRRKCDLETVQTLLLLALREQGRAQDFQAWILIGLAVRISQDLGLHLDQTKGPDSSREVRRIRSSVWAVVCVLDLLLSLQVGKPPAITESYFNEPIPQDDPNKPFSPGWRDASIPQIADPCPLFAHTVKLCQVISRLQAWLYLNKRATRENMVVLRGELEGWHNNLPPAYRVSIGHRPAASILNVHLLYHTAVVLLYRPFNDDPTIPALDLALEAATTFNILLDSYRLSSNFSQCHPHLVYLVFTISISFFFGIRRIRAASPSSTASLASQVALLKCAEALKGMSVAWPLAKRCQRVVEGLMDAENFDSLLGRPRKSIDQSRRDSRPRLPTADPQVSADLESWSASHGPPSTSTLPSSSATSIANNPIPPVDGVASASSNAGEIDTAFTELFPDIDLFSNTTGWADFPDFGMAGAGTEAVSPNNQDMQSLISHLLQQQRDPIAGEYHGAGMRNGTPGGGGGGENPLEMLARTAHQSVPPNNVFARSPRG